MNEHQIWKPLGITFTLAMLAACGGGSSSSTTPVAGPPSGNPPPGNPTQPTIGAVVEFSAVTAGTCVEPVGFETDLDFLKVVDCNAPHRFEVAGTIQRDEAAGAPFPGDRALNLSSHQACRSTFETWVGQPYDGETLAIDTIVPSRSTWRDGDREVICLIAGIDGVLLDAPTGG